MGVDLMTIVNQQSTNGMKYCIIHAISRTVQPIGADKNTYLLISFSCFLQLQRNKYFTLFVTQAHTNTILSRSTFLW